MSTPNSITKQRASSEPTVSHRPTDEGPRWQGSAKLARLGRPGLDPSDETRGLLRNRLRFIGLAITVLWAFVTSIWLSALLQPTSQVVESWLWMVRDWAVFLVAALLTGLLWTTRPLSLPQLRRIEIALFGLVIGNQTWDLYDHLFLQKRLDSLLV